MRSELVGGTVGPVHPARSLDRSRRAGLGSISPVRQAVGERPVLYAQRTTGLDVKGTLRIAALEVVVGEGFRTPAPSERWCAMRGRRSKASQGGNRGEEGRCLVGAIYGDLRIADGARTSARRPAAWSLVGGRNEDEPVRS
jgi:hypothetical protein